MVERMAVMMGKRWVVSKEGHLVEMMAAGKVALTGNQRVGLLVALLVALLAALLVATMAGC